MAIINLNISKKKFKKIATILLIAIIVMVLWIWLDVTSIIRKRIQQKNYDPHEIPTDVAVNFSNQVSNTLEDVFIKDYLNPTKIEKKKAYDMYGYENCKFTTSGLVISADDFIGAPEILITNIWPENTLIWNKVKRPDFGDPEMIEVPKDCSYLYMKLNNVSEEDLKKYVDEIKKEYTKEDKDKKNKSYVYRGTSKQGNKVNIAYSKNTAYIKYTF